jgi:23S rRNA (cytosine1962-C5)-methyltransferase
MATVFLHPGREDRLAGGHLWIYAGEIRSVDGSHAPGDIVDVRAADRTFLGRGYINPRSTIAVRLLTRQREAIDEAFFRRRLEEAVALRRRLVTGTTAFRVVYSEGDGLPGLIVDRYGDVVVIQTLTAGMARQQIPVARLLQQILDPVAVYARNDAPVRRREGLPLEREFLVGAAPLTQEIVEGGVRFRIDLAAGQKTGFFLDQRENRAAVAAYAAGRGEALDAFCYTGGFSMFLARAGVRVLGIDVSADAVAAAGDHARLNGVADRCTFQAANAFDALRGLARDGPRFDLVVLDPPAFAPSRATVAKAAAGYREINLRALKVLRPGGLLISCSCSFHISEEMLIAIVAEAAHDVKRRVRLLEARTQARDHPVHPGMVETRYLKCLILEAA